MSRLPSSIVQRYSRMALVILFFLMLWLPLLDSALHLNSVPSQDENRNPAPWPTLDGSAASLVAFPGKFDAYYNDHFGWRSWLVSWNNKLRQLGLSSSRNVILGKSDWLFLNDPLGLKDYCGTYLLSQDKLELLGDSLAQVQDRLQQQGIRFLLVIAPDKTTIYPEYLPARITKNKSGAGSVREQVAAYLARNTSVPCLNLAPAMLQAKSLGQIYYRTDTHWNDLGAWVGYHEIIGQLAPWFPQLHPRPLEDFQVTTAPRRGGDLTRFLGAQDVPRYRDVEEILTPKWKSQVVDKQDAGDPYESDQDFVADRSDSSLPRLLLYGDSFSRALRPFLAEHFQHTHFVAGFHLDWTLIAHEHPDIVILEAVERNIIDEKITPHTLGLPNKP